MEPRLIIQYRLSKRWTRGSKEPARSVANLLYSLYEHHGLADPSARMGWGVSDDEDGVPYLFIWEIPQALIGRGDSDDSGGLAEEDEADDWDPEEDEDLLDWDDPDPLDDEPEETDSEDEDDFDDWGIDEEDEE